MIRRSTVLVAGSLALVVLSAGCASVNSSLDPTLEPYRAKYGLPAVAAAVVRHGEIIAAGAVGTRKAGADLPVSLSDRFHLGSDTKAFTALLAAMLVDEGKLGWASTVGEVFPELARAMDPGLRRVTLRQLLSHTSGVPGDNAAFIDLLNAVALQSGNLDDLRYFMVTRWSAQPLATVPGTTFEYSNMGYTLAGAMLERVGGKSWEELVTDRVFQPLELRTAGFGPQASLGKIDAPLGHAVVDGQLKAFLAGPDGDNPAVIGPAGTAHMSLLDFAKWAASNAAEGKRPPSLVRSETVRTLHTPVISVPARPGAPPGTPPSGRYALGWGELTVPWAAEPFIYHGGSNEKNLALILLQPQHDFAMVLLTNISGRDADEALRHLAAELYRTYSGRR